MSTKKNGTAKKVTKTRITAAHLADIPSATVRQLKELDDTIKRETQRLKDMRKTREEAKLRLYEYMTKVGVKDFEGINIKKVTPKTVVRKKITEKKRDAINLFYQVGISDPEQFWEQFVKTQKVVVGKVGDADQVGGEDVREDEDEASGDEEETA